MVKNKFSKYANASFSLFYAYVFYFDYKLSETHKLTPPVPNVYVSKFVWLTIINLLLQWLYHTTAAILALGKRQPRALMAKFHFISTAIALPASFTVVVLFWTLYLLDPGTLATKEARIIFDIKWFNHAMVGLT
uniref:Androgen-dependent TFPI-regulating protein n=1 Tax=Globodera rostochiensis TaxID=31243 RepID=A0A914GYY2_GLORO